MHIQPHAFFTRKDNNIHLELPVSLTEAVLGGRIAVPTIDGDVAMTIPKGSNTGTTLRLKGRGIVDRKSEQRGDQYVRLKVVLPEGEDPELAQFVESGQGPRRRRARAAGVQEMKPLAEVLAICGVERDEITLWIERRWVMPLAADGDYLFSEADLARAQMITEFRRDLAIDEDALPDGARPRRPAPCDPAAAAPARPDRVRAARGAVRDDPAPARRARR